MVSTHRHPTPALNRVTRTSAAVLLVFLLLLALLQIVLAVLGAPGFLVGTGLLTLAFTPFIALLLVATPPVTIDQSGLTIHVLLGQTYFVPWEGVRDIADYPLLPTPEAESGRKAMVGRRKYRPAAGKMLVIPTLPLPYRLTGLFVGRGLTGVIALTNRTHTDYEALIQQVARYTGFQAD
ncbi:MAG: hypothetical protein H6672_05000 [Anaerolineaceae bacterium]|nr:hypothetical protein [Anaerolineaceae bacterium]